MSLDRFWDWLAQKNPIVAKKDVEMRFTLIHNDSGAAAKWYQYWLQIATMLRCVIPHVPFPKHPDQSSTPMQVQAEERELQWASVAT